MVAAYVAVAAFWLTTSDAWILNHIADEHTRAHAGWATGMVLVIVSAIVLFWLLSKHLKELATSRNQLSELTQRLLVQEQLTTQRVAQALHDDLGQRLFACSVLLEAGPPSESPTELRIRLSNALFQLRTAMKALRLVLVDLRPPFLEEGGLMPALRHEVERLHPRGALIGLEDFTDGMRWDPHIEYGVFMIAREAMLNAIQHAQASTITTLVRWSGASLTVTVQDDGQGMAHELGSGRPGHLGITGMRERAISLGGKLHIESSLEMGAKVCFELLLGKP